MAETSGDTGAHFKGSKFLRTTHSRRPDEAAMYSDYWHNAIDGTHSLASVPSFLRDVSRPYKHYVTPPCHFIAWLGSTSYIELILSDHPLEETMDSVTAAALRLRHEPVALLWTDEKPEQTLQFHKEKWGCVMAMFAQAALGKTIAFDRETYGCLGGGVGVGFGNLYLNWRGGIDCFYGFLSTGNEGKEQAGKIADEIRNTGRKLAVERFLHGEGYVKSPDLAKSFVASLPMVDIPTRYVVFKPLSQVDKEKETPVVMVFIANADQLSALISLANYGRGTQENVVVRSGAGCQSIGILAYHEANLEQPRAVIGLTDTAARAYTAATLGHDVLTFAVPYKMFLELEENVPGSFLEKETWRSLIEE